jgi:hypothetical protein
MVHEDAREDQMSPEAAARWKGAFRILGWLLVTYAFLIVLMVAIAQQSVMARLTTNNEDASYSATYSTLPNIEERRAQLPKLVVAVQRLNSELADRQTALRAREQEYHNAWGEFLPLLRRAVQAKTCDLTPGEDGLDKPDTRMAMWREVDQCARDKQLPALLIGQFQSLSQEVDSLPVTYRRALAANSDLTKTQARLEEARQQVAEAKLTDPEKAAYDAFGDLNALRTASLPGGRFMAAFAPALVQLLLSAFSGAFGALLVTLVLIVYPNNSLGLTSSGAYGARMLLGALIAIGVYVILLAGTAVLGAQNGFDAAGANYMTFCAVSILAGMFSDRAAYWISIKASTFFKTP